MTNPLRVVAIGDSLIYGRHDPGGGWVGRLRRNLEEANESSAVFNLGIGGHTSTDVLERFNAEVIVRKPSLVIIGVGANDARRSNGKLGVPIDKFEETLTRLVEVSTDLGADVGIATVFPYNELVIDDGDYTHSNTDATAYFTCQMAVAERLRCIAFDFWSIIQKAPLTVYSDVVHLTPDGHDRLAARAIDVLKERSLL